MKRNHGSATATLWIVVIAAGLATESARAGTNLFKRIQHRIDQSGDLATVIDWHNMSGGAQNGDFAADRVIDGAHQALQWIFTSGPASGVYGTSGNYGGIRIELPETVHIQEIEQVFYSSTHRPEQYRLLGSTNGFSDLSVLADWTTVQSGWAGATNTIDAAVRYFEYQFQGTLDSEDFILRELIARPAAGTTLSVIDGYNLLQFDGVTDGTPSNALYYNGNWMDKPYDNKTIDGNLMTYLRFNGTSSPTVTNWFVIPLNDLYYLTSAAVGFYHGHSWPGGITIETTADETIGPGTDWRIVYSQATALKSAVLSFKSSAWAQRIPARYVRISTPDSNGVGGSSALCEIELFAGAPPINLFRRVSKDGTLATTVAYHNMSGGGQTHPAYYFIDSGHWAFQWTFAAKATGVYGVSGNYGAIRLELPETVYVHDMELIAYAAAHRPEAYRLMGSTTGFDALTELVGWTAVASDWLGSVHPIDSNVRYVEFQFQGTKDSQLCLLRELIAHPAPTAAMEPGEGYNLLVRPGATDGVPDDAQHIGGNWWDDPSDNRVIDGNPHSYLRSKCDSSPTVTNWFVLPLNDVYLLGAAAVGMHHGHSWMGGITIETTEEETVGGGTVWTKVYGQATELKSAFLTFDAPVLARNVRVSTLDTGTAASSALNEFELFVVPPPRGTVIAIR
jgi:hypothetical protein